MRMTWFLRNAKKYLLLGIVVIITLISTFYNRFPLKVSYFILKIPYFIVIFLACGILYRMQKKEYKLSNLARKIFFALFFLSAIYITVSLLRWMIYGFAFARHSLYLAMSVFAGSIMFFSVDSNMLPYQYHKRDTLFIVSFLNVMQFIISCVTFGGVRASYLLENIMVYNCVVTAFLPQLFIILYHSISKKVNACSLINIMVSIIFVTLSGSRSAAYVIWGVFLVGIAAQMTLRRRTAWLQCFVMLLVIPAAITVLYQMNIWDAKAALDRSFFSHAIETRGVAYGMDLPIQQNTELTEVTRGIVESDNMRAELWRESINEIKKNPVLGTGVTYFDSHFGTLVLQQSAHNVILEIWLVFGGFGLVIYISLMAMVIFYLIVHFFKMKLKIIFIAHLLSITSILILALVQPLMVMFYPSVIYWLIVSWGYEFTQNAKRGKAGGAV